MATTSEALAIAVEHHRAGRRDLAEQILRRILAVEPSQPDAMHLLGVMAQQAGQQDVAIAYIRQAIRLNGDKSIYHNNLGLAYCAAGKLPEAIDSYRRALELSPDYAYAYNNLGYALVDQGKLDEAVACYRRAVELSPEYAAAHNNLGNSLNAQGQLDAAIACYRRALEIDPNFADAHNSLGNAFRQQGKLEEAVACYRRALELKPDFAYAHNNLAVALVGQKRFDEAETHYRKALAIVPDFADLHQNFAMLLLAQGRFAEGWRELEWRLRKPGNEEQRVPQPRWTGDSLAGRAILLRNDMGLGDMIQFMRYAEPLKQQGARVIVECPRPLARLAARASSVDSVVIAGDPLPSFDTYLPMLSLPAVLGTSLDSIPAHVPYLTPDDDALATWQRELSAEPGFKIGIAWQGDLSHMSNRVNVRFPALSCFEPIARVSGARLYSLQFGAGREQLGEFAGRWPITDLGDRLGDFQNTAAIVRNLDLVITCDSSPAHLAGALGVPVWVALAYVADWRWLLERDDSPWYPTMRLFRQPIAGDWNAVFERMREELRALVGLGGS
jgi:Tfp pilus assembly protein PilF